MRAQQRCTNKGMWDVANPWDAEELHPGRTEIFAALSAFLK